MNCVEFTDGTFRILHEGGSAICGVSKIRLKLKFKIIYSVFRLAMSIYKNVTIRFVLIGSR